MSPLLVLYISYRETKTGLMKEYGHINSPRIQTKQIQVRQLDENKQDFALSTNKQLLIAVVISKYKVCIWYCRYGCQKP